MLGYRITLKQVSMFEFAHLRQSTWNSSQTLIRKMIEFQVTLSDSMEKWMIKLSQLLCFFPDHTLELRLPLVVVFFCFVYLLRTLKCPFDFKFDWYDTASSIPVENVNRCLQRSVSPWNILEMLFLLQLSYLWNYVPCVTNVQSFLVCILQSYCVSNLFTIKELKPIKKFCPPLFVSVSHSV